MRVSPASEQIETAKKLSVDQRAEAHQVLKHPEQIWFVDQETEKLLQQHRDTVIPKLAAVIDSPAADSNERLQAAALLVRLTDKRGRDVPARALKATDSDQVVGALQKIGGLQTYFGDSQPHIRFLLEKPEMADLIVQTLDHSDPDVQKAAIQTNGLLEIPSHLAEHSNPVT